MKTLEEMIDEFSVMKADQFDTWEGPEEWYAVISPMGIEAYFGQESHALAFRLMLINMALNGTECVKDYI
jgi:hypothetical protein